MECEHSVNFYPSERDVSGLPKWKWWRLRLYESYWFCRKCGAEMEPVFKVKGKQ